MSTMSYCVLPIVSFVALQLTCWLSYTLWFPLCNSNTDFMMYLTVTVCFSRFFNIYLSDLYKTCRYKCVCFSDCFSICTIHFHCCSNVVFILWQVLLAAWAYKMSLICVDILKCLYFGPIAIYYKTDLSLGLLYKTPHNVVRVYFLSQFCYELRWTEMK